MRSFAFLALSLGLSGTGSASPGDCTCKEENERWRAAKEKVKDLEKQIQFVEKSIQSHENKILALQNQVANLRMMLDVFQQIIDALFAALSGNPNPVANAGVASAHAQWLALQGNLDILFMQWDLGASPFQVSANLWTQMAQTLSAAVNVQMAEQQGWAAFSGSMGPGGPTMAPPVGPFGALIGQLQNYANQLQKLAQAILDLGIEQLLLDADRKALPQLQEELEKARAEEEATRKAYEECLAKNHGGQLCGHVVEVSSPTLKDKKLDLATIEILSATLLGSKTVAPAVSTSGLKK